MKIIKISALALCLFAAGSAVAMGDDLNWDYDNAEVNDGDIFDPRLVTISDQKTLLLDQVLVDFGSHSEPKKTISYLLSQTSAKNLLR